MSVLAILASAVEAQAIAQWDLPTQPLAESLRAVAAQTDSNIIFDKGLVAGQSARPLKMQASTDEALARLLEGTGLTYRHLDDRTVTIQPLAAGEDTASPTGALAGRSDGRMRMAQAEAQKTAPAQRDSVLAGRQLIDIEEIVVTGTNIRGIENNTAPLIVLNRAYIEASGISTTTRLLESLPQNFALASQSGVLVPGVSDARTQGSSINLRGIGEGTTLVLLNGRRIASGFAGSAVDISALPISAIERVEILTDGASALYGSDAVGGVVNFILRSDFEGAETRLRAGQADGLDEYGASQVVGNSWDSGNAIFSLEYYKRDLLSASDRDFVPPQSQLGSLLPEDENYSAMFSGRQDLSGSFTVFADALYTKRDSFNRGGLITLGENYATENPQFTGTLGVDWRVGGDWRIETSGSYASYDLEQVQTSASFGAAGSLRQDTKFDIEAARIKADGSLFEISGGKVRAAIGADWRSESLESKQALGGVAAGLPVDIDQIVRSAFGELYVPIVGPDNSLPGVHRLELSLAGRYDDYSSFGSSFDPKYGIAWEPVSGLKLRGGYGTSYVSPKLLDYNLRSTRAFALMQPDPASPMGFSRQVLLLGTDVASLSAQESENLSFGLEIAPASLPGFQLGLNYYDIDYTDRIALPPSGAVILGNPSAFGSLFVRNPSAAQVNDFIRLGGLGGNPFLALYPNFNPAAVDVIIDTRRRNLSVTDTSGVDFSTQYDFMLGENAISLGVISTYILKLEQQVTDTSQPLDTVDTYYNPPNWRARGSFGWRRQGWGVNLFVNYTDSYSDNRRATAPLPVSSWTTVDLRLAYGFSEQFGGVLSGLTIAANAQNLLDKDPPRTAIIDLTRDSGFDPTNASPLGRLISIELTKSW